VVVNAEQESVERFVYQVRAIHPERVPLVVLLPKPTDVVPLGVAKVLAGSVRPIDVLQAVANCVGLFAPSANVSGSELLIHLERHAASRNFPRVLALLNATTTFRFSSILRFDGSRLQSVWTFDRQSPADDRFPLDLGVDDSYCCYIRSSAQPFILEDAHSDTRVAEHPKRHELRSYCGVPIATGDDLYGSLCHYDAEPRAVGGRTVGMLEAASRILEPYLA
jgi:GAF domain-containing protein